MPHERKAIRDAIVAQLLGPLAGEPTPSYATAAGARVTASRRAPNPEEQLPAISVYTDEETVDPASESTAPRELKRTVQIAIDGWVSAAADDLEDDLDALALEIETAMDSDLEFAETAFSSVMASTSIGVTYEGRRPMGCAHIVYSVTYHSDLRVAPITDDLSTVDTQFSLAGEQATLDQAHDTVTDLEA